MAVHTRNWTLRPVPYKPMKLEADCDVQRVGGQYIQTAPWQHAS